MIISDEYEVGVHIADVSYFVDHATALDKVAASRATSVYLVQKVRLFSFRTLLILRYACVYATLVLFQDLTKSLKIFI